MANWTDHISLSRTFYLKGNGTLQAFAFGSQPLSCYLCEAYFQALSTTAHTWLYTLSSCAEEVIKSVPGTSLIASEEG